MLFSQQIKFVSAFAIAAVLLAAAPALAQNTSGVSGADVKAGAQEFEYRAAFAPESDGKPSAFAHRLSYKHAFDGSWSAKVIALQSERGGGDLEFRSVSIEVLKQFLESEDTGGWDSAIRVDGLIPTEDNRPGRARAAWLNSVDFGEGWQARGNIYMGREIGDLAKDGFTLETREELTRKLDNGMRIGAQMFNNLNTTAHLGSFDEQRHQIGPVIKGKISKHVGYNAGVLFGISDKAPDTDFRLFITYSL
jgi:hypothetical protein